MTTMVSGLIITAIGMGLVFLAIIFLWGLMALMVRLDSRFTYEKKGVEEELSTSDAAAPDHKQKAAAAAIAVALALAEKRTPIEVTADPAAGSAWLSVQRAQVLQDKSRMFSRHPSRRS